MDFGSSTCANIKAVKIKIPSLWPFEKIQFLLFLHTNIVCIDAAKR